MDRRRHAAHRRPRSAAQRHDAAGPVSVSARTGRCTLCRHPEHRDAGGSMVNMSVGVIFVGRMLFSFAAKMGGACASSCCPRRWPARFVFVCAVGDVRKRTLCSQRFQRRRRTRCSCTAASSRRGEAMRPSLPFVYSPHTHTHTRCFFLPMI